MINFIIGVAVIIGIFFLVKKIQSNSPEAAESRQLGLEFLAENGKKEGVVSTASGLQYQVLNAGDGEEHPAAADKVLVHYHGTLTNDKVFDSSVDRGEPISFGLNQVIKGWTEGLQLMVVGEKTRLFIPSELAYGSRATGGIPANSVLIFDVELLAINP
ncbi:MAG: FKBP-type peptidyl-prolyl cis-trans isomerase [Pseudomonadales bacterium]|nr:FKBP-type peptidyl-prolyl cis-trans isomerase [Pseudomonadales bacterium]